MRKRSICLAILAATFSPAVMLVPSAFAASSSLSRVQKGLVDVNVDLPFQGATGAGTGMVLGTGGEILTNNHVIRGATAIRVVDLGNHRTYAATVVGYDIGADVAVIHLSNAKSLFRIPLGNSARVLVSQPVTALGNAGGVGGKPSASRGKVMSLHQSIVAQDQLGGAEQLSGLIETSAALQPGDSGGALVSTAGKVIGMNTAGSNGFRLNSRSGSGFAVPINQALRIARAIEARRSSATIHVGPTAFLGVDVEQNPVTGGSTSTVGLLVTATIPGTPATAAGLQAGDIITSFNNTPVTSPAALTDLLVTMAPGTVALIGWLSPIGTTVTASVTLATGPAQ